MNTTTPEPAHTSPAPDHVNQDGVPPPKVADAPPPPSCGPVVNEIAANYSMHPYDVVVLLSGVLGNIAGPHAGLVNGHNALVRPATNILLLDNNSARVHELEHALVQPLRARTDLIRERAAGLSRRVVDLVTFGRPATGTKSKSSTLQEPWLKEHLDDAEAKQKAIVQMKEIPREPFDYTAMTGSFAGFAPPIPWRDSTPGINHLPTVLAERTELAQVPQLLAETFQREAFLFHPTGGIFGRGSLFSASGEQLANSVAGWLQGVDMPFPSVHHGQGYGTYAAARAGLWAAIDSGRIGTVLDTAQSQWNGVLHHCLLWSNSASPTTPAGYNHTGMAMIAYQRKLHAILEMRCHGDQNRQCRTILPLDMHRLFAQRKAKFLDALDQVSAINKPYVIHMHDLPERILWVLSLFAPGGDLLRCAPQMKLSLLRAAFEASFHALRIHTSSLSKIRDQAVQQKRAAIASRVAEKLKIMGPLTFRQIQRSTDSTRKADLQPGIELLIQRGQVRQDSHQRYSIIAAEKNFQVSPSHLS